jgi:hypothetical protein
MVMKHLKRINELQSQPISSYEEALDKMCKFIAEQIYHDEMGGSMFPRYRELMGVVDTLSILYGIDREKVKQDIDDIIEEYRTKKRNFRD